MIGFYFKNTNTREKELFTEDETVKHCEFFFSKYEELAIEEGSLTFEDLILKHALLKNDTISETATFLFKFFKVQIIQIKITELESLRKGEKQPLSDSNEGTAEIYNG